MLPSENFVVLVNQSIDNQPEITDEAISTFYSDDDLDYREASKAYREECRANLSGKTKPVYPRLFTD